jgi:hypothetical protein
MGQTALFLLTAVSMQLQMENCAVQDVDEK